MLNFLKILKRSKNSKIPTDLEILNTIYDLYHQDFVAYDDNKDLRSSKIFVPIDSKVIANRLSVNGDIVFGRLYYHLEEKYGYKRKDGSKVSFYALKVGRDIKCINFPLMVSVLAAMRQEHSKYITSTRISLIALIFSVVSFLLSLFF